MKQLFAVQKLNDAKTAQKSLNSLDDVIKSNQPVDQWRRHHVRGIVRQTVE